MIRSSLAFDVNGCLCASTYFCSANCLVFLFNVRIVVVIVHFCIIVINFGGIIINLCAVLIRSVYVSSDSYFCLMPGVENECVSSFLDL